MVFTIALLAQQAAPQAPGQGQPPEGGFLSPIILIGMMLVLFYFMMIRPAQRQEKQRQALISTLKKNDKILNSGGIIGIVDSIKEKDDEILLKGGLRITRSSIVRVFNPEEAAKEGE